MLSTLEPSLYTTGLNYEAPGNNLVTMDVHPDITVMYGNRAFGNMDPRFSSLSDIGMNRARLLGESGCTSMVLLVPHASDIFHDLEQGPHSFDGRGYGYWPEAVKPDEDVVTTYDRQDPTYFIDLPGDGLITERPGEGLSMNGADCPAAVLYDEENKVLGVGHVGRKGATVDILPKMLHAMHWDHGTNPEKVIIHFSPSIAPETHVIKTLDPPFDRPEWKNEFIIPIKKPDKKIVYGVNFVGFAIKQLIEQCGVPADNIKPPANIDVGTDSNFFSLTQTQVSEGLVPNGRNAFVAVIN